MFMMRSGGARSEVVRYTLLTKYCCLLLAGDVAILLSAGWPAGRIAIFQLMSAATAFIGLYLGVSLASVEGSSDWIFVVAAGMFLYVALGDVVSESSQYVRYIVQCGIRYDMWGRYILLCGVDIYN